MPRIVLNDPDSTRLMRQPQADAAVACHAARMPTLDEDGWQLESGVERHAEARGTFEIPEEADRSRLVPTCDAKLIFTLRGAGGPQVERMWVHITGYTATGYVGILNNEPRMPDAPIALGQVVDFGPTTSSTPCHRRTGTRRRGNTRTSRCCPPGAGPHSLASIVLPPEPD